MKRLLALVALATTYVCSAQTAVTPIVQPHMTFVDSAGLPCSLCQLYSYVAGTTTPQPTWTDSTGTVQNSNPIILDVAGGPPPTGSGAIWPGANLTYKYVLKNALGATIWTVDNVKSNSGGLPCPTPFTIQFSNSTGTSFTCDPNITIDPSAHAIKVGGTISGPFFTLRNLSTIPNSWTLDVTSPATALASLAPIPLVDLDTQNPDTVVMNAGGTTASPTAVALPSGCTSGVNYDTSTHAWTCAGTAVQGPDTVLMNATAGSAAPTPITMPSACTVGVNYDTTTHTWTCVTPPAATDYYFSFSGCTLAVGGNSVNCQGNANFASVSPVVPTQPDSDYYLGCSTLTGVAWGSSTGINSQSSTGFQFSENVDRWNGIPATVTPTVWCHLHHN